jgi:nitrogenase subunit NifH
MRGKLILVAGFAVGYVLGSRAGKARYDQISKVAGKFWNSRPVQHQVHNVEEFAKDKAPDVVDFVGNSVRKAVRSSSAKKSAVRKRPAANSEPTLPK